MATDCLAQLGPRFHGKSRAVVATFDLAHASSDPIHELLLGTDPLTGPPLASQPTLSRFENVLERTAPYRVAEALADTMIERHRQTAKNRIAHLITTEDLHRVNGS